jgi:hypothetical protein
MRSTDMHFYLYVIFRVMRAYSLADDHLYLREILPPSAGNTDIHLQATHYHNPETTV